MAQLLETVTTWARYAMWFPPFEEKGTRLITVGRLLIVHCLALQIHSSVAKHDGWQYRVINVCNNNNNIYIYSGYCCGWDNPILFSPYELNVLKKSIFLTIKILPADLLPLKNLYTYAIFKLLPQPRLNIFCWPYWLLKVQSLQIFYNLHYYQICFV